MSYKHYKPATASERAAQKKGGDPKKGGERTKGQKTIKVKTGT